jgi:GAF domain-containing protein
MTENHIGAPIPENEEDRLSELYAYDILDTEPETIFDDITFLAAQICDTPIALVSLVDRDRQWFKSRMGLEATETGRDLAFCAHAVWDPTTMLVVDDALTDYRFSNNPLVRNHPCIRFYAGAPLLTSTGNALGTLCVIDREPRELSDGQQQSMLALSRVVMKALEYRKLIAGAHPHAA